VDSYVRIVGSNGTIHADFVRGTVQRQIGPGSSGIDKALAPYRIGRQLLTGTTATLFHRVVNRQRSYPGLTELFEAFYRSIRTGSAAPISEATIAETVRVCEQVGENIAALEAAPVRAPARSGSGPTVVLTGGTGFLGRAVARRLVVSGARVRVLARRAPAPWDRIGGADYVVGDLGAATVEQALNGADVVIHAAAETAGGWAEHEANSIRATEQLLRSAAAGGVRRVIHVSSLAVLAAGRGAAIDEDTPLLGDSRSAGPYVWGKLESERLAQRLAGELGIALRVVRPGAIVDYEAFDPPGRLGKRLGNIFVAVGSPRNRLGVVDLDFAARALTHTALHFEQAPPLLNLLSPTLPTKSELIARLRANNPDLTVFWLPMWVLKPLSLGAIGLQRLLRPGKKAIDVATVFRVDRYDTRRSGELARALESSSAR
jgi:nucleoside-diphosphate-sugar epimerase